MRAALSLSYLILFALVAGAIAPRQEDGASEDKAPSAHNAPPADDANHHRELVISVDGLRPDVLLRADAPNVRKLMERGSFTFWAQTTAVSVTLPSHVSMMTGVRPQVHQIEWNHDVPLAKPVYPSRPTLFEVAKKAGRTTAMAAGKSKFGVFAKPGAIDYIYLPQEEEVYDDRVLQEAVKIAQQKPDVFFVHFPEVDIVGHSKGWGSREQVEAVGRADQDIGALLSALKHEGTLDSTLVIISADHGGAGLTHGADDVRSRNIPWIAAGPGVRANYDLTQHASLTVKTEDTFATACDWIGAELPKGTEGKPVKQIFEAAPAGK